MISNVCFLKISTLFYRNSYSEHSNILDTDQLGAYMYVVTRLVSSGASMLDALLDVVD